MACTLQIEVGDFVKIKNQKGNRQYLNSELGEVAEFEVFSGKWIIKLFNLKKSVKIRAKDLVLVTCDHVQTALLKFMKAGKNIALLGRPGYGKTLATLLCGIGLKNADIKLDFTGTTGMAATNYAHFDGKTFHAYFLGGTFDGSKEEILQRILKNPVLVERWKNAQAIAIDEISMFTAWELEVIDFVAKHIRKNSWPMGGIQLLLVGDFFQLNSTNQKPNEPKLFQSKIFRNLIDQTFILEKNHRILDANLVSGPDLAFEKMIDEITENSISNESKLNIENVRYDNIDLIEENFRNEAVILTTHRSTAYKLNLVELDRQILDQPTQVLKAHVVKNEDLSSEESITFQNEILELQGPDGNYLDFVWRTGAKVFSRVNDTSNNSVNGAAGVVVGTKNNNPVVRWKNGVKAEVKPLTQAIRNKKKKEIGEITYIPLKLGYCLTIHQAQGQEYNRAILILNIFAENHMYTAITRVKNFEGLKIVATTLNWNDFRVSQDVYDFYENKKIEQEIVLKQSATPLDLNVLSNLKTNPIFDNVNDVKDILPNVCTISSALCHVHNLPFIIKRAIVQNTPVFNFECLAEYKCKMNLCEGKIFYGDHGVANSLSFSCIKKAFCKSCGSE
jgi:hypothetical protein